MVIPMKEDRKGKQGEGKGGKGEREESISHLSSPSSKKYKIQKVPWLYHTNKYHPLSITVPGLQPRNVLAYSDLRNPRECQQRDAGDGLGSPHLWGINKSKFSLKSSNNRRKKPCKRDRTCAYKQKHMGIGQDRLRVNRQGWLKAFKL